MKMTDKYAWLLGAAIAVAAPASGDMVPNGTQRRPQWLPRRRSIRLGQPDDGFRPDGGFDAIEASSGASREAAVSAANHAVLTELVTFAERHRSSGPTRKALGHDRSR